jgi:neutral ceramidase
MPLHRRLIAVVVVLVAAAPVLAASGARVFKAGAATSNITPQLGGAEGPAKEAHARYIHDELHVRCLVLDDGGSRLVFAVVDRVSVNREAFDSAKRLIQQATGIPPERMMMSATHTHRGARGQDAMGTGIPPNDYQTFLVSRIVDGVRRAVHNLEPARIGWGSGQVPQHVFNRRLLLKEGKTAPNPFGGQDRAVTNNANHPDGWKPAGPTNPEVYFISVQSLSGRPIALLANYWLHYAGPGTPDHHISADYFGEFCDRIQQLLGADRQDPPFVGLLANGPCGDVNHLGYKPPPGGFKHYERVKLVANDVAQEVLRVHRTIQHRDWVELKSATTQLELKLRQPTPDMVARAQQVVARKPTASPVHKKELEYARKTLSAKGGPETVSIVMQAFAIGELGIAAIPFETFTETGLEIKAKSPFKDTFTIELANGGYGYLPTPAQHEWGGYETWLGTSRVEKEATVKITDTLVRLLNQLAAK